MSASRQKGLPGIRASSRLRRQEATPMAATASAKSPAAFTEQTVPIVPSLRSPDLTLFVRSHRLNRCFAIRWPARAVARVVTPADDSSTPTL